MQADQEFKASLGYVKSCLNKTKLNIEKDNEGVFFFSWSIHEMAIFFCNKKGKGPIIRKELKMKEDQR